MRGRRERGKRRRAFAGLLRSSPNNCLELCKPPVAALLGCACSACHVSRFCEAVLPQVLTPQCAVLPQYAMLFRCCEGMVVSHSAVRCSMAVAVPSRAAPWRGEPPRGPRQCRCRRPCLR